MFYVDSKSNHVVSKSFMGAFKPLQSISMFPDMMTPSNCVKKLNIKGKA
jgi:hypothetical protein